MRLCRSFLLATSALTLVGAASASAMSLQEAATLAITTNPQMEAAKENRRAQVYELKQGRGLYYPRLDLSADVGPEWSRTRALEPSVTMMRYDSSFTLTQILFDGFEREARIDQRAARLDGAAFRVEERAETLSLDASEVYLDMLRYNDLISIASDNIATHESILSQVRQRVEGGESGVGDLQQTESRLAAARETLVGTEQDLRDARARFSRIVGREAEGLTPAPSLLHALPGGVTEAVAYAINNSPTLRARAAVIDEAIASHREAAAAYYPTIEFQMLHSQNYNVDGTEGISNDARAMLRMNWNLFNGGIDTARRTELAHRVGEQRAEVMNVERSLAQETKVSWNALEAAQSRVAILQEQVASNTEVVETYRQEFQIGQRDLLDLLDSENELFLARSALVSAQYVVEFAAYRVLAVMGALSSTLGIVDPPEAVADARAGANVTPEFTFGNRTPAHVNRPAPEARADAATPATTGQDQAMRQPSAPASPAPAHYRAAPVSTVPTAGGHLPDPEVPTLTRYSGQQAAQVPTPAPGPLMFPLPVGTDSSAASLNARSLQAARPYSLQ